MNYEVPWNPMRVEQRIGRIDRLGQEHPHIRIINLQYADTVEADVYPALRDRIDLFQTFVGRLQPILARLPRGITDVMLDRAQDREIGRANLVTDIQSEVDAAEEAGFNLDEVTAEELEAPPRPDALYSLADLEKLLRDATLVPPGLEAKPLGSTDFAYLAPGISVSVRVTTDPDYYDQHPESTDLWSPGNPLFPTPDVIASPDEVRGLDWRQTIVGEKSPSGKR